MPGTRRKRSRTVRILRDLASIAAFVLVVTAARSSLADHYRVPSPSMEPGIVPGDRVVVDKRAYGLRLPFSDVKITDGEPPSRGDAVVLESPEDGTVLLKRVAAVPGDRVEVEDGALRLNGEAAPIERVGRAWIEKLGDPHRVRLGAGPGLGPVRVPEGRYLVLGDNRVNSRDGRYFGFVKREDILGRVVAVYYRDGFTWIER